MRSITLRLGIVVMALAVLLSLIPAESVNAYIWVKGDRTGYFGGRYARGNYEGGNGFVLTQGIPDGLGDADGNPNDEVDEFINYVYNTNYKNGIERDRIGASYIIHSMIGQQQTTADRDVTPSVYNVSDDEYNRWVAALKQPNISVNWHYSGCLGEDTYFNTEKDVAHAYKPANTVCDDLVVFTSGSQVVYVLERTCANPDGNSSGLPAPDPTWSIGPSSAVQSISGTASTTSAKIGSTVTWLHTVKNNGPSTTDRNVAAHYQNRTGTGPGTGSWSDVIVDDTALGGSLKSLRAGRCMDADTNTMSAAATKVQQYDCSGQPQQTWRFNTSTQAIKTAASSTKCLNATGGSNSSTVNLITCNGRDEQKWKVIGEPGGRIRSEKYPSMCLDVNDDSNTKVLIIYTCHSPVSDGSGNQQWIQGTEGENYNNNAIPNQHTRTFTSKYKITAADVGRTLCRATSANPGAWNYANWVESTAACVTVPYDFNLTPATSGPSGIAEPGAPLPNIIPTVNNTGTTKTNGAAQWQLSKIIVSPTGTITTSIQQNPSAPCTHYGNTCTSEASGSQEFPLGLTSLSALAGQSVPNNAAVGTKVCFALSVKPYMVGTSDWRHGIPVCVVVGKTPKVQVLGGDLVVGRGTVNNPARVSNVGTAASYAPGVGRTFGSWSEYAIIPSGTVKGMASGSLYVAGSTSSNLCDLSVLTISNSTMAGNFPTCTSGSIGAYIGTASRVPNSASRFPVTAATPKLTTTAAAPVKDINTLAGSTIYTSAQAALNISSSVPIAAGRWVVINAQDTTITIKSNIQYTSGALSGIGDIPQVVIIAKNILIDPGVTNIDAWLVATGKPTTPTEIAGYINTCSSVTAGSPTAATLNASQCNNKLTVNGPVQANRLFMYRTAGAGTGASAGDPAEVFNLRADAYVWASAYSPGTGRVPTVDTKELPPRF